jgi:hypothetical protein
MDLSRTIMAKSDQLNADDLVGGPITITVQEIKAVEGDQQQPIAILYGDQDGKAYKPCKSMRRVLVAVWGTDGKAFIGRRMTLYRDPSVMWGGVAVGGLRISHMSNLDTAMTMVISASKTKKKPIKILPLPDEQPQNLTEIADSVGQDAINDYLLSIEWIKTGETHAALAQDKIKTVLDNEGAFLAAINKHKTGEQQ